MKDQHFFLNQGAVEVGIIPVLQGEPPVRPEGEDLPETLPILALRNVVIFPGTVFPVNIGRDKSILLVHEAEQSGGFIGAVPQTDITVENPGENDLNRYGTAARIVKTLEMPDGSLTAILQGFTRFSLEKILSTEPYLTGKVRYIDEFVPEMPEPQSRALSDSLKEKAGGIIN